MPMPHSMNERASSAILPRQSPPLVVRHSLGSLPSDREAIEIALVRHSAPMLARSSSTPRFSSKDVPENILMRTEVHVAGVAARENHCVYALEVDTGFGAHVIHKRYSEIRDFRVALLQAVDEKKHCNHGPCSLITQLAQIKFPRRRLRLPGRKRDANIEVAKQRLPLLERFLQAMLRVYRMASRRQMRVCTNSQCILVGMIKRFLDVSDPVFSEDEEPSPTSFDVSTVPMVQPTAVSLPRSFPDLQYTSLHGDKPSSLFSIAETEHEHAVMVE